MRALNGQANLYVLGGRYYFRRAVPKNLSPYFEKKEYKKALKAPTYRDACRKVWIYNVKTDWIFETVAKLAMKLSPAQIKDIVRNHFEKCLMDAEDSYYTEKFLLRGDDEQYDPEALGRMRLTSEQNLQKLSTLRQNHEYGPKQVGIARQLLRHHGIALNQDAPEFHEVCYSLVRAHHEAERINYAYLTGREQDGAIKDQYFQGCTNYFEAPNPSIHFQCAPHPYHSVSNSPSVVTLSSALDAYKTYKRSQSGKRGLDAQKLLESRLAKLALFISPEKNVAAFTVNDGYTLREKVLRIPNNHKHMANHEIVTAVATEGDHKKISVPTMENYWAIFKDFFDFCRKRRWTSDNILTDIALELKYTPTTERRNFTDEELATLFSSPLYTGHKNPERGRHEPGTYLTRDGQFWVPLIGLFQGMRMAEILGIRKSDVKQEDDIYHFDIKPNAERGLKNNPSARTLPIHAELIKMGLLNYLNSRRDTLQPGGLMFEDGITLPEKQKIIKNYSRSFGAYLDRIGLSDPSIVFHSFRHNFCTAMATNADISLDIMDALDGRAAGTETSSSSRKSYLHFKLSVLKTAIDKVRFNVDLSHLYVKN